MRVLVAYLVLMCVLGCGEGGSKPAAWQGQAAVPTAPAPESKPVWDWPKELPKPKAETQWTERSPGNDRTPIAPPVREEVQRDGERIPPPPGAGEEIVPAPKKDQ